MTGVSVCHETVISDDDLYSLLLHRPSVVYLSFPHRRQDMEPEEELIIDPEGGVQDVQETGVCLMFFFIFIIRLTNIFFTPFM